jgi:uncharacterized membrane protein YedE/YeeE
VISVLIIYTEDKVEVKPMTFANFAAAQSTVLWVAFGIAFVMGAVVNKTNFCTMGAVSDLVNMNDSGRMRAWFLAVAVAIIGVIVLESMGVMSVDISRPPYRGSNFAWLEYLVGGIMFGIGMTYGSGCGNKTLIRMGGGNLKSLVVFAMIALCAFYMINPFPGTDKTIYSVIFYPWTHLASMSMAGQQDLGSVVSRVTGMSDAAHMRMYIGGVIAVVLLAMVFKSKDFRSNFDNVLAGIVVGAAVLAAWYASGAFAMIDADGDMLSWVNYASNDNWAMLTDAPRPQGIAVQSFTFINPIGETLGYAKSGFSSLYLTFGVMAVFGVVLGSFFWSIVTKGFRIEWFVDSKDLLNHVIGGVLMGIGGVLALGCTIGQAITGASTLSIGSFIAFAGIVFGSALTMKMQYYKLLYEEEATFMKSFLTALVDMRLLPSAMRKLEAM